jgi:nitrite reductase/ring-hydroxylating ferredoxin subunit
MTETRLCALDDIADGGSDGFTVETAQGKKWLMVIRKGDGVFVYLNSCPHIGSPLDLPPGRFLNRDSTMILCTTHGALFRIEDGYCVSGPCAEKSLSPVAAEVRDGEVFLLD